MPPAPPHAPRNTGERRPFDNGGEHVDIVGDPIKRVETRQPPPKPPLAGKGHAVGTRPAGIQRARGQQAAECPRGSRLTKSWRSRTPAVSSSCSVGVQGQHRQKTRNRLRCGPDSLNRCAVGDVRSHQAKTYAAVGRDAQAGRDCGTGRRGRTGRRLLRSRRGRSGCCPSMNRFQPALARRLLP